jgi:phosphopantetheine adenylyltransferase
MIDNKIQEDGFPGGIGIGLDLPGGYINGAPTGSQDESIKNMVLNNITESDFDNFIKEYFDKIEQELLTEDDSDAIGFPYTGTDALDSPQNYVNYVNKDWAQFDSYNYVSHLPGWNVQGHLSDSYPDSATKIAVPVNNHNYENGPAKIWVHDIKGEEYKQHAIEKWEVSPHLFMDKTYTPEAPYQEFHEGAPGVFQMYGIQSGNHSIESLANVNNVSVEEIKNKIAFGAQQEIGVTNDARLAVEIAKNNIAKDLHYYENRTKVLRNLREEKEVSDLKVKNINDFINYAVSKLKLKKQPKIHLINDTDYANKHASLGGYNPETKEIVVVTNNRLSADILRTIAHELVHRKQDELSLLTNPAENGKTGSPIENQANAVAGILMRNYGKINKQIYTEGLLLEGGAAGHLAHPFEDEDLTFNDMKEMINRGLIGGLDKEAPVSEKLDGQNIAFSVRDGKVVFGRNKGHVRDSGKNALDTKGIYNQFKGRGGIEKAFVGASEDLQAAVKKLSPQQIKKMFGNGSKFMSLEIILPETQNVIPYGKTVLVMHGTITYDKNGEQIERSTEDGKEFAEAVKKVGADRQKTFGIEGPKTIAFSDADAKEYTQKAKEFNSTLTATAGKFGLSDKAKLGDYRRAWWMNEINNQENKLGIKFSPSQKKGLVNRFADGDKSFGVKNFEEDVQRNWFRDFETNQLAKAQKQMIKPIEHVFLNAGAQSLKRVTNFLSSNNPGAANALTKETLQSIKGIKNSKDVDKIAKLQVELERLETIGMDKIVPSEGVVFQYNGKPYKFTGLFAPINQIQGTFKFDKPKKKEATAVAGNEQPKEEGKGKTIAIFSGRFQPFHAGHYSIYKSLVEKFGKDNVYVASSNVQDPIKSPFTFKDKKETMTRMFGIPPKNVVQVKDPYKPVEILSKVPDDTKYVTAVSQKDAERLEKGGKYFKNYNKVPDDKKKGYNDEGYFIVAPEMQLNVDGKNISGTQLRATFGSNMLSIPEKKKIFQQVYPKFDKDVFAKIVAVTKKAEVAKKAKETKIIPVKQKLTPKPKDKGVKKSDIKNNKNVQKVLQTKIKNPETGNLILVKSALKYDDKTRVKKLAVSLVKQALRK